MENFLQETKASLHNLDKHIKVHAVLGNEACDLDSAVAALIYSFYLHKANVHPGAVIVPILNIKSQDLRLRTEIVYFFKENHISFDSLIFREDVHLKALLEKGKLTVTLVDHNNLTRSDFSLYSAVIEVIDHHKKEANYEPSKCNVTVEMVGSCCTLIAEKILKTQPGFLDQQLTVFLYGTILLDTVCLNEAAKRVTPKDKAVAAELEKILTGVNRIELFQNLYKAKFNISDLTMEELLKRDLKVISNNTMSIPIATLTTSLETVLKRPEAEIELQKFSCKTNSQILVLMGIEIDVMTQETSRQLAIYSPIQGYREQLVDVLEAVSSHGPKLQLHVMPSPFSSVVLYQQGNVAASRKIILPLLNTFLLGDQSPSFSTGSGASGMASNGNFNSNRRLPPDGRSDDEDMCYFDPLAAESEDVVLDSMASSSTHLHVLGMGDPISHAGSSQSSSNQNSCPYTPQNSCTDGGLELDPYARQILPSFNSREMMEKIESKRGKLRGYIGDGESDASYPFTPKNSFVDNTFESYVKTVNLPSFDSGDFLLKVNEKVSTMDSTISNEGFGNITVEVPILDKSLKNGRSDAPVLKDRFKQLDLESGPRENQEVDAAVRGTDPENHVQEGSEKNKENIQRCPEAISLSDKLDKSDEKMDTSETGSSEKTSPLPNDIEVQTSTTATTTSCTTTNCLASNANLHTQKNNEGCSETTNPKTDSSTASISSLQGEDADLEMPVNYQTETVDFPDSPRQLKLMNQSVHEVQGASLDDPRQEDGEETEQQDDEVFRAVLSPSNEGVKLKKVQNVLCDQENISMSTSSSSKEIDSKSHESDLALQDLEYDDYFGDGILAANTNGNAAPSTATWEEGAGKPLKKCMPISVSSLAEEFSYSSSENELSFDEANDYWLEQSEKVSTGVSCASTPKVGSTFSCLPMIQEEHSSIRSSSRDASGSNTTASNSSINLALMEKVRSCFDHEKIKDVYVLCGKPHDLLSPGEINEILQNSESYLQYFDTELFESLQNVKAELSKEDSGSSPIAASDKKGNVVHGKKTRISVNKDNLDQSIVEHFESELQISAIFEGTSSIRLNKTKVRPKLELINENPSCLSLLEVPCGITEAFFEESAGMTTSSVRRKICADLTLGSTENINSSSPDRDSQLAKSKRALEDGSEDSDMSACHVIATCDAPSLRFTTGFSEGQTSSPERPNSLNDFGKKKLKIRVNPDILNSSDDHDDKSLSSMSNRSEGDILSPIDDIATPDDIDTPDFFEDSTFSPSESIPEVSAAEERDEERRWRTCVIGGVQRKIDMKVIEPYKKVLSHGGYYGPKRSAIIVFCACYLPDHSRKDYDYVMDNLFLYVLTTLDQLVAEDYILVYLHGAMDRNNMPTFGWLKRCYQMIDRRLRKNLKGLYLVHPTFWLKTIVVMTRPFISSKFSRKLQFVNTLQELSEIVPIDQMSIPDRVKQLEFELMIKEKKKHTKPQNHNGLPVKAAEPDNASNWEISEEAYRKADLGYHHNFTSGWV